MPILAPDQARVKTVINPDPDSFRPQNQRSRTLLDRIRILVPDGRELGTLEQPAMQVYVYALSFGSLCTHRSVNPRGNASAFTTAKPATVATPDLAVRLTAGRHVGSVGTRRVSRRKQTRIVKLLCPPRSDSITPPRLRAGFTGLSVAALKGARFAGQSEPAIGPRNQS